MHELELADINPTSFRNACGLFATGVTVIATKIGAEEHGMTANAFMSISLEPPLVAISVARSAKILGKIRKSGRFSVSVLKAGNQDTAMHFAGRPNPSLTSLFGQLDGLPVLRRFCAAFATDVEQEAEAGDHIIFVGRVRAMQVCKDDPLLFHGGKFCKFSATESQEAETWLQDAGLW